MKRSIKALVLSAVSLALAAAALAAPASAVSPVASIDASASLAAPRGGGLAAARFDVVVSFSTDTPGALPFTVQKAVILFPDRAGTNGHLFPSCSAARIERHRGDLRRCPRGSRIGGGTVTARALQLGVTATGRVAIFNGADGRSITFNIQTTHPAYVNESIDARLIRQRGVYGEKLVLTVPHSLQEILTGVYVGVRTFDVTLQAKTRVNGVEHSYLRARTCPTRPIHGVVSFKDWTSGQTATATADARVRCRRG